MGRNMDKNIKAQSIFGIQNAVVIRFRENKPPSPQRISRLKRLWRNFTLLSLRENVFYFYFLLTDDSLGGRGFVSPKTYNYCVLNTEKALGFYIFIHIPAHTSDSIFLETNRKKITPISHIQFFGFSYLFESLLFYQGETNRAV